jgi:glycosyltransferase involved in cell wall biosynthesis
VIRIAIDYTPAVRQQAGIGRIVKNQVSALIAQNPGFDLRLFIVGRVTDEQRHMAPLPLHATPINERNMVRLWHRLGSPWPAVEHFTGGPLDLFHATDFVLAPTRVRHTIVTVHDLAFLHYPDASHPSLYHYLHVVVPRSIRKASHIIADSHHTARDIQEHFRLPLEQISVVQGAVDHAAFSPMRDEMEIGSVKAKYGIGDRPYIFALGSLQPRKNFGRLIEAYSLARRMVTIDQQLVIGGAKGWLYDDIYAKVADLNLAGDVRFTGYICEADLAALYSGADLFAYPSLYEGFGLPIIEALACGTPVLTADNSCLAEAGGPGALYVDAHNTQSIAEALVRLCTDSALRNQLASIGRIHASHFTWERSASQLIQTYLGVLAC